MTKKTIMPEKRANELLNEIIDYTAIGRNSSETIQELIRMGFKDEELWTFFSFNLHDVADAMEDMYDDNEE